MPLTLITGPANAAKAGVVLERFRAALPREPVLVVPTPADAEHYQRELSAEGIVVGAEVVTFTPAGAASSPRWPGCGHASLGPVARERLVRAVVAEADLHALARSAAAPGFAGGRRRAVRRARPLADRPRAVHARGARLGGHRRGAVARGELAQLYSAYHRRLERAGRGRRRRATRGRRSTRCASGPPPGAAGRCSSTGSTT